MNKYISEVDDPATSAERLRQIAAEAPELGAQIAKHPNCYPELSEWIEQNAPVAPTTKPQRVWKAIGITAAIVAPLIAAASIAIPAFDSLSQRESSADTLSIASKQANPFADTQVIGTVDVLEDLKKPGFQPYWKIPADAPFETFPMPFASGGDRQLKCSDEQTAWLHEHGEPTIRIGEENSIQLSLHNNATETGALPIGNIRFVGEEVPSTPSVFMNCDADQRGDVGGIQPMKVDVSGNEAVYGEALRAYGPDVQPEGSPVTLNLSAGEVASVVILRSDDVDRQRAYKGRIVADVLDGSNTTVTLAEEVTFERDHLGESFRLSAVWFDWDTTGEFGDITCVRQEQVQSCTPSEAATFLSEAARSVR